LFSSDATRDSLANIKASMAAIFPAQSAAAQSDRSHLTVGNAQKAAARPSATEDQTPGARNVITAAVAAPAREEIRLAYQNALQGRAPATSLAAAPVAEPPAPQPPIHQLDPDAIASLLQRADALIASGDVAAARLVLRRAADAGDAHAAMTLAETYDPAVLEKLGVHGFVPDLAMARSWYEKARAFGSAEAPRRLETLASKRQ
jgi:TPR repeat protein